MPAAPRKPVRRAKPPAPPDEAPPWLEDLHRPARAREARQFAAEKAVGVGSSNPSGSRTLEP